MKHSKIRNPRLTTASLLGMNEAAAHVKRLLSYLSIGFPISNVAVFHDADLSWKDALSGFLANVSLGFSARSQSTQLAGGEAQCLI